VNLVVLSTRRPGWFVDVAGEQSNRGISLAEQIGRRSALTTCRPVATIMGLMRRVLFTLFLAFALGVGGVTNAAAAQDCPMEQGQSAGGMHDCCDDQGGAPVQDDEDSKMAGCAVGMSCRTVTAIAPLPSPNALRFAAISASFIALSQPPPPSGPLQELFRPPRAI
jgi:hypothetical protein